MVAWGCELGLQVNLMASWLMIAMCWKMQVINVDSVQSVAPEPKPAVVNQGSKREQGNGKFALDEFLKRVKKSKAKRSEEIGSCGPLKDPVSFFS